MSGASRNPRLLRRGNVRPARREDIPRLREIRASVTENRLSDPSEITDEIVVWHLEHAPFYVWEQEGTVLGFCAGDPRDGSIWSLFVDPAAEGQSIGRTLLWQCCNELAKMGHKKLTLSTEKNSHAEHFYKALGWAQQGFNDVGEVILALDLTDSAATPQNIPYLTYQRNHA